jgi:hypothetical protein
MAETGASPQIQSEIQYDPSSQNVDEVLKYLRDASPEEAQRVVEAEKTGKNRSTITSWESAPEEEAMVRYIGSADRRIISAKDWQQVGASGLGETIWDVHNQKSIPVSEFPKAALSYLRGDPGFEIEG